MKTAPKLTNGKLALMIAGGVVGVIILSCCFSGVVNSANKHEPETTPTTEAYVPPPPPSWSPPPSPTPSPSPSPVPLMMPDVVGLNGGIASELMDKLGFTNVHYGSADPDDTLVILRYNWKIIEQSHSAGETLMSDTMIVLTCSKKR